MSNWRLVEHQVDDVIFRLVIAREIHVSGADARWDDVLGDRAVAAAIGRHMWRDQTVWALSAGNTQAIRDQR